MHTTIYTSNYEKNNFILISALISIILYSVTQISIHGGGMNPFKYGQIVLGNDFCPRPQLQKQIREYIQSGQNFFVQGEKQAGKNSLIYEVVNKIKTKRILHIDLLEVKSIDNFCKRIIKSIISLEGKTNIFEKSQTELAYLKPIFANNSTIGTPTISFGHDIQYEPHTLEMIIDFIQKLNSEKQLVVVLDEFQDILNLKKSNEVFSIFQKKIRFHNSIPYIFIGSIRSKMYDIFNNPMNPFFKTTPAIEVKGIEKFEFRDYLNKKFSLGKRIISDEQLHTIFHLTDSITGDVQQFCNAIWEVSSFKTDIKKDHLVKGLQLIYTREFKGYNSILVNLTAWQIKCLVGLAKMGGSSPLSSSFLKSIGGTLPSSVKKALMRLEQLKVIYRKYGEYKFINPFFKLWLLNSNLYS